MIVALGRHWRGITGELIRFGSVGVFSFALGAGLSALFSEVLGFREEISVAISLSVLLVTNFWLSARFVFRTEERASYGQFARFAATSIAMRGSEYLLFLALFKVAGLHYLVALTAAMATSSGIKFFLYRVLVFGRRPHGPD
jgi:putative flippase GtrA